MNDFAKSACEILGGVDLPDKTLASLFAGDHLLSTGQVRIEVARRFGTFWPLGGKRSDIPDRSITLKVSGIESAMPIKNLYWCGPPHYHFDFD